MEPLILYGGTFNPIHLGHMGICAKVHEKFPTGTILLMPTARPPHKTDREVISGEHRLAMCRIAARPFPYLQVDRYELDQGGKSYTIDTLLHLRELFPQRPIYLLIGTDMFLTFRQWRRWQEIGKLAVLVVASRQRDDRGDLLETQRDLAGDGIRSLLLDNEVQEISSTQIRRTLARERTCSQLPDGVLEYILEHGLYTGDSPAWDREALRRIVRDMVDPQRYRHTLGVERQAERLALKFGENPEKAAVCGILHDICKNMPPERMLQLITDDGIMTENRSVAADEKECAPKTGSDIPFSRQPQLLHSYAGAAYLRLEMGISDPDILNAVRYHTTGRGGMSKLEKIVYLADLTSEDRDYPDVDQVRKLTWSSLEEGMKYSLQYIVGRLAREGGFLCRDTVEAYNEACGYPRASNGGA